MERIEAVQIIGTQRSGSNLLRLMLNQIKGVFAPHPPHIIATFYDLLPGYGHLENDNNFKALIDDVCTLVELNPVRWESLFADRNVIFKTCQNRSLSEIFRVVYELNAVSHGANLWICKSMQNVRYLDYFKLNNLNPKLIYLYRDGRDVALSFKKAIVGPKHIYSIANKWRMEQELSIQATNNENLQSLSLSYELLIQEPEIQLHRVCEFLGIEYKKDVLEFYNSEESLRTADAGEMWSNLKSPIIRNNTGKYLNGLSADELKLFENRSWGILKQLGYKLQHNNAAGFKQITDDQKSEFEKLNLKLQIEAKRNASKSDLRKRGAQDDFIKDLKKRLNTKAA